MDSPAELDDYRHGGILQHVLRQLAKEENVISQLWPTSHNLPMSVMQKASVSKYVTVNKEPLILNQLQAFRRHNSCPGFASETRLGSLWR